MSNARRYANEITGRTADCITADDLRAIGIVPEKTAPHIGPRPNWYTNADKTLRVCLEGEEGVEIHQFTNDRARLICWSVRFAASTPIRVVLAAIEAVG